MYDTRYSPPRASVVEFSAPPRLPRVEGFHDLTGIVRWLAIALGALILVELLHAVSLWLQIGLLSEALHGGAISREAARANVRRESIVSIIFFLSYVVTAILFLRWTYLAKKNAMALGASYFSLEYSPGWSVGSYFVPFVNLVSPYKFLKETFQASYPEFRPGDQRLEWCPAPKLLPFWWALWLANGVLSQITVNYSLVAKSVPQLLSVSWWHFAGVILGLPLFAMGWVLISTLQTWQLARLSGGTASAD